MESKNQKTIIGAVLDLGGIVIASQCKGCSLVTLDSNLLTNEKFWLNVEDWNQYHKSI